MRRFSPIGLALGLSLVLASSCRDALVAPAARIPAQAPARSVAPTVSLDQDINALIDQLFPLGVRPFVHAGWDNLKLQLARSGPTGEPTRDIKQALGALVTVMQANTARLTTALGEEKEHALARLVLDMELYVFNGPDTPAPVIGPKADLVMATVQPTVKATIQTPSKHAGVEFPAGAVSEPTTVIVAQEAKYYPDNCSGPLNTTRCQYPQFYHFNVFPDKKLNVPAKVAVCHVNSGSTRAPLADHDRFRLAHDKPTDPNAYAPNGMIVDGIEILPFVSMPGLATCGTANTYTASAAVQPKAKSGFDGLLQQGLNGVARLASAIGNVISPKELYAIDQGGGGELLFFSTFAVVDPQSAPDIRPASGFSLGVAQAKTAGPVTVNTFGVENIGTGASGPSTATIVLAADTTLTIGAQVLATVPVASVVPGSSAVVPALSVVIPATTLPGKRFLGVKLTDSLTEISTANNFVSSSLALAPPSHPLSANDANACTIKLGATYCWGANSYGMLGDGTTIARTGAVQTVGGLQFVSLAGAFESTCGLTADGIIACWGLNLSGEIGNGVVTKNNPTPTPVAGNLRFQSVHAGVLLYCGLTFDGSAYCWGGNWAGGLGDGTTVDRSVPTAVSGSLKFVTLGLGQDHGCGLSAAGVAYCWGDNVSGDVGDGTTMQRNSPVAVLTSQTFVSVTGGNAHTCALSGAGDVYCWGLNDSGELGDGTTTTHLTPTPVTGGHKFTAIQAAHNGNGEGSTCGLATDGTLYCWGSNILGQLGDGTSTNRLVPTPVAGAHRFTNFDVDNQGGCAIDASGAVYCWGMNAFSTGGKANVRLSPTPVIGGAGFSRIAAGTNVTCGVRVGGAGACWGDNRAGTLGTGSLVSAATPQPVTGGLSFTSINTVGGLSCGLTSNGAGYCWGYAATLGDGVGSNRYVPSPVAVAGGHTFTSVDVGAQHACGLTAAGAAFCWGANGGALGDGTTGTRTSPSPVAGGHAFASLAVGNAGGCGLTQAGAAWCWGSNTNGELGSGNAGSSSPTPVIVTGGRVFTAITSGAAHNCALTGGGAAYCWGSNATGQLGTGQPGATPNPAPLPVGGGLTFAAISAGGSHTCALTPAGAAYCWGSNGNGELGNGSSVASISSPMAVAGGLSFAKIAAGRGHTCGVTLAGDAYCWGQDFLGQVGDGTVGYSYVPVFTAVP